MKHTKNIRSKSLVATIGYERTRACVDALAGIEDPEAFVKAAKKSWEYISRKSDCVQQGPEKCSCGHTQMIWALRQFPPPLVQDLHDDHTDEPNPEPKTQAGGQDG